MRRIILVSVLIMTCLIIVSGNDKQKQDYFPVIPPNVNPIDYMIDNGIPFYVDHNGDIFIGDK